MNSIVNLDALFKPHSVAMIGASANVVVCQIARKNRYPITFWQFTRYGLPLMIVSVAICSVYLYWRYIL